MERKRNKKQNLIPLTARHGEKSYKNICDIADEFNCSKSIVVRLSTTGHLEDYYGRIRFYNKKSTAEIKMIYQDILNIVNKMYLELSYQGKNLNQLTKLYHTKKKLQDERDKFYSIADDMNINRHERNRLLNEQESLINDLEAQIKEYESDSNVANAILFNEISSSFIKRLDNRIKYLEDIALQKGSFLPDENEVIDNGELQ